MDWTQTLITSVTLLVPIIGLFYWLRSDIKSLRSDMQDDMRQLRSDMQGDMKQLRSDMQGEINLLRSDMQRLEDKVDIGFKALDDRLRAVESEQSRVVGLLEGLGLSGALPSREPLRQDS